MHMLSQSILISAILITSHAQVYNRPYHRPGIDYGSWWNFKYYLRVADMVNKDSEQKIRQISNIIDAYMDALPYEIGMVMGMIREKYRYMMEVYRQMVAVYTGKTMNRPPAIGVNRKLRPLHFFVMYEYIHLSGIDIEKLIEVLEDIPKTHIRRELLRKTIKKPKETLLRRHRDLNSSDELDANEDAVENNTTSGQKMLISNTKSSDSKDNMESSEEDTKKSVENAFKNSDNTDSEYNIAKSEDELKMIGDKNIQNKMNTTDETKLDMKTAEEKYKEELRQQYFEQKENDML